MEKRVVLAVVLTIAVIFLSNVLFPTPERPAPSVPADSVGLGEPVSDLETGAEGDSAVRDPALGGPDTEDARPDLAAPEAVPPEPTTERPVQREDTVRVSSDLLGLKFSTLGAALVSAELLEYESYGPNGTGISPVQLIRDGDRVFGYRLVVGTDTVRVDDQPFSVDRMDVQLGPDNPRDSVVFRYRFPSSVEFVVRYAFSYESYRVEVAGRLEGLGERGYSILTSLGHGLKTNEKNPTEDHRQLGYAVRGQDGSIRSVNLDKIEPGEVRAAEGGPFDWVAVKNKYFLVALLSPEGGPQFGGFLALGDPAEYAAGMVTSMPVPAGSAGFGFDAYVGPQEYRRLEAFGRSRDLEHVNPYGWRWMRPIIRPLVGIVMVILEWLHGFLGLAYGWVLIVFGVAMRVVLFPLYQKSMRAQLAQMQVQPLMKELQTKHKDDPQKLQSEMMKLYKEHNVNPLAGCLPMLLPMPILFALFFVFQSTIEFRGVPFLWLPDLSLKDPYYIIPLIMGASMFLLSWIGQRGMEANPQMKMMTYVMPVVFTVLFANFPSGLNLYYATSNLASLPQQLYLSKERKAAKEKADRNKAQKSKEDGG
jgi:YidC/Oxa1 family membrane protein insertase